MPSGMSGSIGNLHRGGAKVSLLAGDVGTPGHHEPVPPPRSTATEHAEFETKRFEKLVIRKRGEPRDCGRQSTPHNTPFGRACHPPPTPTPRRSARGTCTPVHIFPSAGGLRGVSSHGAVCGTVNTFNGLVLNPGQWLVTGKFARCVFCQGAFNRPWPSSPPRGSRCSNPSRNQA